MKIFGMESASFIPIWMKVYLTLSPAPSVCNRGKGLLATAPAAFSSDVVPASWAVAQSSAAAVVACLGRGCGAIFNLLAGKVEAGNLPRPHGFCEDHVLACSYVDLKRTNVYFSTSTCPAYNVRLLLLGCLLTPSLAPSSST